MSENRFDMLELGEDKPKVAPNASVFTNVASLQPREGATAKQIDGQWVNSIGLKSSADHRHVAILLKGVVCHCLKILESMLFCCEVH